MALVFGRMRISKPFNEWYAGFSAHQGARAAAGIEDVLCAPVIGSQEVIYVVRTEHPRRVHDLMWSEAARPLIEASGHVLGSESFVVCDEI
ncbi:DUF3764 family protein [Pseudomonas citronellolis]|uniref:DUF3764 family protein n=1 Tax=Pseudomonas citronellolis TaxID=53408 RepID=UPI0009E9ECA4|nr:DUF3764 family protein [Pseudomonas citronellolis]